jgi:PAS domain-containing protein
MNDNKYLEIIGRNLDAIDERKTLALQESNVGIWDWNVLTGTLWWDENMFRIYNMSPTMFKGKYEDWYNAVHPDDRENALAQIKKCFDDVKARYFVRFRLNPQLKDGTIIGVGNVIRDNNGYISRMVGINILEPQPIHNYEHK